MRFYSHIAVAAGAAAALHQYQLSPLSAEFSIFTIGGLLLGSVLPDIDETKSWIGRRSHGIAFLVKLIFGHRGITHSGIALVLCIYGIILEVHPFLTALSFGAASHILADLFSRGGIPLFYPFDKKRTSIPLYKTGSVIEHLIVLFILFYLGSKIFI